MCGQIEEADGAVLEHCLIAASDIGGVRSMVVFSLSVHNIYFSFYNILSFRRFSSTNYSVGILHKPIGERFRFFKLEFASTVIAKEHYTRSKNKRYLSDDY